jgi:hypothetical protein
MSGGVVRTCASIVEQNDFALFGEAIGHRRIPMVHGAHEMHVEDEWHVACFAKTAIGKAGAISLGVVWWV